MRHPGSIAARADALRPFVCSWTSGGLEAGWVHMAGALDIATTPQLERALREPGLQTRLVVLDMRELAFLDAAGAQAIVDASIRARAAGTRLVVLRGSPEVDRLFGLTGSTDDVEIGDIGSFEPSVQTLVRLVDMGGAP